MLRPMLILLAMWLPCVFAAPVQQLKYASLQRSYIMTYSAKALSLVSMERSLSIPINGCNRHPGGLRGGA